MITQSTAADANNPPPGDPLRGEELSRAVCATCHLWPRPDLMDRRIWEERVLPNMWKFLGLAPVNPSPEQGPVDSAALMRAGVLPSAPLVSRQDWADITSFYARHSPPGPPSLSLNLGRERTGLFKVARRVFAAAPPAILWVKILPPGDGVFISDARSQHLLRYDSRFTSSALVAEGLLPVSGYPGRDGWWLTSIGSFLPTESATGSLVRLDASGHLEPIVNGLQRPVQTVAADINGDGRTDLVISEFGWLSGRLSWHERRADGSLRPHVIFPKAGAMQLDVRDLDHDGDLDIAVLVAQGVETLFFLRNDGSGNFEFDPVVIAHPAFGFAGFELLDFDRDGELDVLTVNGDLDYPAPPRPYHGIRIYQRRPDRRFAEALFLPLPGAYAARVADFDRDGDLDIAAIAYHPDFEQRPDMGFVYFRNDGPRFSALTLAAGSEARWMTMDAGDLDGDGDVDLVLGGVFAGPQTSIPPELRATWAQTRVAVLVLRNTAADPSHPLEAAYRWHGQSDSEFCIRFAPGWRR